jgi:hypothetical protein
MRQKKNFKPDDLFKLETLKHLPDTVDRVTTYKIRELLKVMKVKQAFVVPFKNRGTAQYLNRKEKFGYVLQTVAILPAKKFVRVIRIK